MQKNINTKVTSIALIYQPYLSRTMALLTVVCTVAVFLYGVFLLEAVAHAASSTNATRQIHSLSASLSQLESQYLSQTQALTPQRAQDLGFVTPSQVSTVAANAASGALSFATQPQATIIIAGQQQ